jgi:hypothetical protein
MKRIFLIFALLLSSSAFAANCGNDKSVGNAECDTPPVVTPATTPGNVNTNRNLQGQLQGQAQGQVQGQSQIATGGAGGSATGGTANSSSYASGGTAQSVSGASANNSQSVTFTSPENSTIRTTGVAPDIIASPTAPCRIAVSASGGWIGGAFGFGTSVLDESCRRIEVSRQLHNMGQRDAAVKVMCNEPEAAAALGEAICPPKPKEEVSVEVKP